MLTMGGILSHFGFEPDVKTKLVRHQDQRFDVSRLYRAGQFETYQSLQSRPVFEGAQRLVSFLGRPGYHGPLRRRVRRPWCRGS